jgi:hypothetical protein
MVLARRCNHPSHRCYVIKLHRVACAGQRALCGRAENLVTGRWFEFACADELATGLERDLARGGGDAEEDDAPSDEGRGGIG